MRFLPFAHYGITFFMHNNEFSRFFYKIALVAVGILPVIFWFSLIFSFDTPKIAFTTLIAVLTHEAGHLLAIFLLNKKIDSFRGTVSGFKIRSGALSYKAEFLIYLGGPLANAVLALISLLFTKHEYAQVICALNIATCISNLIPAEGYDGYGLLRCFLMKNGWNRFYHNVLECTSMLTLMTLCIISLYLMDRCGEGFWLYFIFFFSVIKKLQKPTKGAKNEK